MFPQWQAQCKRIHLHIMASKTLWKQMSRKWFYLESVSSSRRISKRFSKTWLNTDGQEAGLSSWDICSPLLPQRICVGDSTSGSLTLPWADARKTPGMASCAADTWKATRRERRHGQPAARTSSTAGRRMQQGRDVVLTLCVAPYRCPSASSQCSGAISQHKSCYQENAIEISNILHYVSLTTEIDAGTEQAPLELSNKI